MTPINITRSIICVAPIGVVQEPAGQVPPAAAAAAERGPEQGAAGQEEEFPHPGGELGERGQRTVHPADQYHHRPHCSDQHRACVHLEPRVHLPAVRPSLYLIFVHATILSDDLHSSLGLQPGLRRVNLLLWRHGLRLVPDADAPPAAGPGLDPQSHGH